MPEQDRRPEDEEALKGKVAVEGMLRCLVDARREKAKKDQTDKEPTRTEA